MAERALITLLVGVFVIFGATALAGAISDSFHKTADRIECASTGATVCVLDDAAER